MSAGEGPPDRQPEEPGEQKSLLTRFRTDETGPLMFLRELLTSVATVAAVGLLLFAISGVWPPMVAVESGSMDPHMQKGDLIFVTEPGRYMPDYAHADTGVVTYRTGEQEEYRTFEEYGSVVVYNNPSTFGPPIIHRARFWVADGENWYDKANKQFIAAESCSELRNCPAPHAGFVTKGDNNPYYDQANGISSPVKPEWVVGTARLRIPYLGWVRLGLSGAAVSNPVVPGVASAGAPTAATALPGAPTAATTVPGVPTAAEPLSSSRTHGLTNASGAVVSVAVESPQITLGPSHTTAPPNTPIAG